MRTFFAVLLGVCLSAQSPPPNPSVPVGYGLGVQSGGLIGRQLIGGICAPGVLRVACGFGPPVCPGSDSVGLGGTMCWWAEAVNPTATPATYYPGAYGVPVFFAAGTSLGGFYSIPGGAFGFDLGFLDWTAPIVIVGAPYVTNFTSGGVASIPAGGYDRWYVTIDIPVNSSLVGVEISAQSARLDPLTSMLYFSDEWIIGIWS